MMSGDRPASAGPPSAGDLAPAARRFKAGHWLALLAAVLVILGAIATGAGAPHWLVGILRAGMAAAAIAAALAVVPAHAKLSKTVPDRHGGKGPG
jgi:hypothetical protein